MPARVFLDTNVFVYLSSTDDPAKKTIAGRALNAFDCAISTQVINELSNVLLRKYDKSTTEVKCTIQAIESTCDILLVTIATTELALEIHDTTNYSYYDSLIVASALESDCQYLLSEDLQDQRIIKDKLTIVNVFEHPELLIKMEQLNS
jgi:predicted nucleic acid-binding protein